MSKKHKNYSALWVRDKKGINLIVLLGYIVCALMYGGIGYFVFSSGIGGDEPWKPILYYLLLVLPILSSLFDYKNVVNTDEFKYALYLPSLVFYLYLILFDYQYMYFIYAVFLICMSVIFLDMKFSSGITLSLFFIHIFGAAYLSYHGNTARGERVFQAFSVLIMGISINLVMYFIRQIQRERIRVISFERNRFEALSSLEAKYVFEYDFETDNFELTKRGDDLLAFENRIRNFHVVAKQFRYVLNADWEVLDYFAENCSKATNIVDVQMRLRTRGADYLWYQINARPILDEENGTYKIIGTLQNIDERKRAELRQMDENMRDPLTKLYRRAYAKQLMQKYLAERPEDSAALLILDLDNFKVLCEKMGKTFGDEVLRSIASDLDGIFYSSDILGRAGGDEFYILMKNVLTDADVIKKVDEVQRIVERTYIGEGTDSVCSISIGIAVYKKDGTEFLDLYSKAEKALYHAKQQGKNAYAFYDESLEGKYEVENIENKHNEVKMKDELEQEKELSNSDSLIELAFKLIEDSKDTDSAIQLLMRQIVKQLELDGILIRTRVGKEFKVTYPYQSFWEGLQQGQGGDVEFTEEEWNSMVSSFEDNHGLIICEDVMEIEDDQERKMNMAYGIQSYAKCAFYDKGDFAGNIDFVVMNHSRHWSKDDMATVRAVTNVISSYLLKMKAYEDASETVERLTGYDAVTGFYKYEKFTEVLKEYLKNAEHGKYAMVYVDFKNFKYINDTYGYAVGDQILTEFAEAARKYVGTFVMGSRVFSDNLVCLLNADGVLKENPAEKLLNASTKYTDTIKERYIDSKLTCVIGVCLFDVDGSEIDVKALVSNANLARKEAKKPDKPRCIIYNDTMSEQIKKEIAYTNDMEAAFNNHEFVVYMQPKVDLQNHIISGAEALIRWVKPDGTIIYPNDFIPVFEKNKSVTQLDYYVYREVCKYLAGRIARNEHVVNVSMNVSRIHLYAIDELIQYIDGLLKKYQLPPELLEFELTETVFTDTVDDTVTLMQELRKLGVKVSMDDFGSGYSSLNVLTKLPLDVLKLDKEFLRGFEYGSDEQLIIPSIIDMAKKLNLHVVCEGVETMEQVEYLRCVGCDVAQGYYYSKPVPLHHFNEMLSDDDFVITQEHLIELKKEG